MYACSPGMETSVMTMGDHYLDVPIHYETLLLPEIQIEGHSLARTGSDQPMMMFETKR
jgi:hypothetical protein